jgi:hypothetical protein
VQIKDEKFAVDNRNAATHLARNTLDDSDRDRFAGLLVRWCDGAKPPIAGRAKDRISVQSVFLSRK